MAWVILVVAGIFEVGCDRKVGLSVLGGFWLPRNPPSGLSKKSALAYNSRSAASFVEPWIAHTCNRQCELKQESRVAARSLSSLNPPVRI
jgi:hypothetical protein